MSSILSSVSDPSFLSSYLFSFILFGFVLFLSFFKTHFSRTATMLNKFPGGPTLPIIGDFANIFIGNIDGLGDRIGAYMKKFGPCSRAWAFHYPTLLVSDYKVAEKILSSQVHLHKGFTYELYLKMYLGNGLITSDVPKWKKDRKQLNAGMNYGMFERFLQIFNKHAAALVEKCISEIPERESKSECKEMLDTWGQCTMSIIGEAALGLEKNPDNKINGKDVVNCVNIMLESFSLRTLKPYTNIPGLWNWLGNGKMEQSHYNPLRQNVISHIKDMQEARNLRANQCKSEESSKSIIDILLDPESMREPSDIFDHVLTMLAGGTDTTSSGINYTLYLLALNPDHQRKVQKELDDIFSDQSNKNVSFEDLSNMKYTEKCIKEALRIFPPIPQFSRTVLSDVPLDDKLVIPKGTFVTFVIYEMHRDPNIFPDPESFVPERFSSENISKNPFPQFAYLPFSGGPRNCIGLKYAMMEMKVILAYLLRQFTVTTSKPRKDLKLRYDIVLKPIGGIPLSLSLRKFS